mmetsp:Transcript_66724/g.142692  ORF Transcript_66724/g.142692 Transcript_66724/m.142692 type:complete len:565 (-) Transcript_66724:188-1882(-)
MAASRYTSLTPVAPVGLTPIAPVAGPSVYRRRVVGLAAFVAGSVACAVLVVTKGGARQTGQGPQETSWEALAEPFRKYEGTLPMPDTATQYDGIEDMRDIPVYEYEGHAHVFAIGDWGAPLQTNHLTAFNTGGGDEKSQYSVANAMINRAKYVDPQYVLNVGDNFYIGGIEMSCNEPPSAAWGKAKSDFSTTWQAIYGPLAKKPWLSTLGNHDYGGWMFNQGWPQQIGYSFVNHNWVMPARYFSRKMQHVNFVVEYFMIDSNAFDAREGTEPNHDMCSMHNPWGASCAENQPGLDMAGCRSWFWTSYEAQKKWLEEKLAASVADWKVVVTHFPCGYDGAWYRILREKYGLDLLVTGHRHQQELWWSGSKSTYIKQFMQKNELGDLNCFVTGGGGGITHNYFNDADYGPDLQWYGFFDLTISKRQMKIELIGIDGSVHGNVTIFPLRKNTAPVTSTATTTATTATTSTATTSTDTTTTRTTMFPPVPTLKPYEPPPLPTWKPYKPPPMPTLKPYKPPPTAMSLHSHESTTAPTATKTAAPTPTPTTSAPSVAAGEMPEEVLQFKK